MPSGIRIQRIADRIRQELADMLIREISDPRLQQIFITDVKVDRELAYAPGYRGNLALLRFSAKRSGRCAARPVGT